MIDFSARASTVGSSALRDTRLCRVSGPFLLKLVRLVYWLLHIVRTFGAGAPRERESGAGTGEGYVHRC